MTSIFENLREFYYAVTFLKLPTYNYHFKYDVPHLWGSFKLKPSMLLLLLPGCTFSVCMKKAIGNDDGAYDKSFFISEEKKTTN